MITEPTSETTNQTKASSGLSSSNSELGPGDPVKRLSSGMALVASLVSLFIAVAGYLNTVRPPQTSLVMPTRVRISFRADNGNRAHFVIQPTLIIPAGSEHPEVVTDISLHVTRVATGETTEFKWNEVGTLTFDPIEHDVDFAYLADPSPLLITGTSPQLPVAGFYSPIDWRLQPGSYRGTLIVQRTSAPAPLQGTVEFDISDTVAEMLGRGDGSLYSFDAR